MHRHLIEVAKGYPFSVDSPETLRSRFLEFNIEINTQIRKAFPEQYNTNPSQLNQWPEINDQKLQEFYRPSNNERANLPRQIGDLAEGSSSHDWGLEDIA